MRDAVTVLVTGGGAPGIAGTIYSLRYNPDGIQTRIVACDARDEVVGKYLADAFYVVPPAHHPEFLKEVLRIARKEGVDVILPQVTRELAIFARGRHYFEDQGIAVAVASNETIAYANDKWHLSEVAKQINVPVPESILVNSHHEIENAARLLGYPQNKVVVKPRFSHGQRGFRILTEERWNADRFFNEKPDATEISLQNLLAILQHGSWSGLIVQEHLPGEEYTVDVFYGHRTALAIPRMREELRSGITFKARVVLREDLINYSLALAQALDLKYAFGFQFKLDANGTPKLLECNPRVQGTMVAATLAGVNVIWYAVREALGEAVQPEELGKPANGMRLLRYWGGIAVYADGKTSGPI